jgi:hypothetical protein
MASELPTFEPDMLAGLTAFTQAMARHQVAYALIGGMATSYRAQPRFTKDLDFLLAVPQLVLPILLEDLAAHGFTMEVAGVIEEWTRHHLATVSFHGTPVDWLKPVLPVYQHVLEGAKEESWLGRRVRIATAEGLILLKLLAFRAQDLADIESLVAAHRDHLDVSWICSEWQTVADLADPRMQRFLEIVGAPKP